MYNELEQSSHIVLNPKWNVILLNAFFAWSKNPDFSVQNSRRTDIRIRGLADQNQSGLIRLRGPPCSFLFVHGYRIIRHGVMNTKFVPRPLIKSFIILMNLLLLHVFIYTLKFIKRVYRDECVHANPCARHHTRAEVTAKRVRPAPPTSSHRSPHREHNVSVAVRPTSDKQRFGRHPRNYI